MTDERKEELVRELIAFASEQGNTLCATPQKVLQEITNDIAKTISPCSDMLMPFYIAALECVVQSLRVQFRENAEIADDLKRVLTCYSIIFPHHNNK